MVILADKTALRYLTKAQQHCEDEPLPLSDFHWPDHVCLLGWLWFSRCVKEFQDTHGFRQQRARCSVQPRADQSKHTNETLIGLNFRPWLSAPSFPSPAHAGMRPVLFCQHVLRPRSVCFWMGVQIVATTHTYVIYLCSEWICFNVKSFFLVCSSREIRNAKSLTYIDPEAFKNLPNLKYLWVFFTACSCLHIFTTLW